MNLILNINQSFKALKFFECFNKKNLFTQLLQTCFYCDVTISNTNASFIKRLINRHRADHVALRSGNNVTNEVYPRCVYCQLKTIPNTPPFVGERPNSEAISARCLPDIFTYLTVACSLSTHLEHDPKVRTPEDLVFNIRTLNLFQIYQNPLKNTDDQGRSFVRYCCFAAIYFHTLTQKDFVRSISLNTYYL